MADPQWIKIVTKIFENRKIKLFESMKNGDTINIIWIKILCLAGDINNNGLLSLTDKIPYDISTLAIEFRKSVKEVETAINLFLEYEMLVIVDGFYSVKSWSKYQNIEGLDKIREDNRKRVAEHRERQKSK